MGNKWRYTKDVVEAWIEKYWRDYVFIHINKTAGSSIEKALGLRFRHMTAQEKIKYMGRKRWDAKFSFGFVRNPWDRAVSYYHYRVRSNQTGLGDRHLNFREWVQAVYQDKDPVYRDYERMFMPQRQWLIDQKGVIAVTMVGRFETLEADFDQIKQRLGFSVRLPHEKSSDRGDYRQYFDTASVDIIAQAFEEDIEEFGYQFD